METSLKWTSQSLQLKGQPPAISVSRHIIVALCQGSSYSLSHIKAVNQLVKGSELHQCCKPCQPSHMQNNCRLNVCWEE